MSKNRKDIKKFTTLSVPQMITNEEVSKDIRSTLNENIEKRLDHHMQSAMKKTLKGQRGPEAGKSERKG